MSFNYQNIDLFDVSFYQTIVLDENGKILPPAQQKHIDFHKMMSVPYIKGVIIRAGQHNYRDIAFLKSWENAGIAGIPRASYWFCDKDGSPESQARLYWDIMKSDPGEGFLCGDLEVGSWTDWNMWYRFFNELQQVSGSNKTFLYTNRSFWSTFGPKTEASSLWFSERFPLWIAAYTTATEPLLFGTWDKATLWQDSIPVMGYQAGCWSKEIDHNKFNGTLEDFELIFGQTEENGGTVAKNKVTVIWDLGAKEREAPSTLSREVAFLPDNSVRYSDFDEVPDREDPNNSNKRWIKLQDGYYIATLYPTSTGAVARRALVEPIEPPPPPSEEYILHVKDGVTRKFVLEQ